MPLETEAWFKDLVEHAGDLIQCIDSTGRFIYVNQTWRATLGYSADEVVGLTLWDIIHCDSLKHCRAVFEQVIAGNAAVEVEATFVTRMGAPVMVEGSVSAKFDEDSQFRYSCGIFRDVGERKQIELALRESEQELKTVTENMSDIVLIIDLEGRFTHVSGSSYYHLGYTTEEMLGMSSLEMCHEADRERVIPVYENLLSGKESEARVEFRVRGKSGKYVWFESSGRPLFDDTGQVTGILAVSREIGDRKEAEARLAESERRLRNYKENLDLILENVSDNVWSYDVDAEGRFVSSYISPAGAKQLGIPEAELNHSFDVWFSHVIPEDLPLVQAAMAGAIESGRGKPVEYRVRRPDGSIKWVRSVGNPIIKKDGGVSLVGNGQDITESKQAEEALRASETRYRSLLDSAPDTIARFDRSLRHVFINKKATEELGLLPEQIVGKTNRELGMPKDVIEKWEGGLRAAFQEGKEQTVDIDLETPHGYKHYTSRIVPEYGPSGNVDTALSITRDITGRKRLEQELSRSEERFQKMLSLVPDLVSIQDANMNIVYSNWNGFGAVSEEKRVLNSRCYKTYRGLDQICPDCQAVTVLQTGEAFQKEMELPGGTWVDLRVIPILGQDGSAELFVEWVRDITERKKAEKEIMAQHKLLEGIMDNVSDVLSIQYPDHRIERYNQAGYELLGMTPEEVKGRKCHQLIGKDRECEDCATARALQSGKLEEVERYFPELGIYLNCRANPVFEDGRIVLVIQHLRDITSHKRAEEALKASEQKHREILAAMEEGYYEVDLAGNLVFFNASFCRLTGYSEDELMGKSYKKLYEDPQEVFNTFNHVYQTGKPVTATDWPAITGDGRKIHLEFSVALRRDEKGEPVGFRGVVRDITERQQTDERIRYLSYHDQLTGLYNRHFLEEEMSRLDTERQLPISIIMADLNGLKLVNDTIGHLSGDEMLQKAAAILRSICREDDLLARFGGDEFVLYLPRTPEKEARKIGERIEQACRREMIKDVPMSLCTGLAVKVSAEQKLTDLLREAEDNMYRDKLTESRSGKSAIVSSLLQTLAAKSFETETHTRNMQEVANSMGEKLGLPHSELNRLQLLITLHDIGKINIPEELLTKKESLSSAEWEIMKKHSETGYRIAKASENFSHVAEDILAHHERWDGSGYPQGLKGEKIPLLSRITAIADAYEVMSNGRPYKKAMGRSEIAAEFKRCSGSQFDPELVELFLPMLEGDG